MDQVNQFEQQIFAVHGSSVQLSQEPNNEALNGLIQIFQNIDFVGFCIQNFGKLTNPLSKLVALDIIEFWISEKFNLINGEILQAIQRFIFSDLPNESLDDKITQQLSSTQSQFFLKTFPEHWPDFFAFLFQQKVDSVANFLAALCSELNKRTPNTFQKLVDIRASLRRDGIVNQILNFATKRIQENNTVGYAILSGIVSLCPIEMFFDSNFQSLLLNGMQNVNNPQIIVHIFKALENIIKHHMDQNVRKQLIGILVNPENISNIIKASNNVDVYTAAASLISVVSIYWLEIGAELDFFYLGLNFIQLDETTASIVRYSVYSYMMKHPNVNDDAVKTIFGRMISNFSDPNILENFSKVIGTSTEYSNIIISSLRHEQNHVLPIIESFAPSFDFNNSPGVCSAMIHFVNSVLKSTYSGVLNNVILDFRNLFIGILQVQLPYNPNQIMCLYELASLALEKGFIKISLPDNSSVKLITDEEFSQIIATIFQITLSNDINDFIKEKLLTRLPRYTFYKESQRIINIDHNILSFYIQSMKYPYVGAVSQLIRSVNPELKQALDLQFLQMICQTLSQSQTLDNVLAALSYIENINSIDENVLSLCQNIIDQAKTQQAVLENDLALSKLIKSAKQIGQQNGIQIYSQIFQYIKSSNAATTLCSQLLEMKNMTFQATCEWLPPIIQHLFGVTSKLLEDFFVKYSLKIRDRATANVIKDFLLLVSKHIASAQSEGNDDYSLALLSQLFPMIHILIDNFYTIPVIYGSCLDAFLELLKAKNLSSGYTQIIMQNVQQLFSSSFNCIYIENLNLASEMWKNLTKKLLLFHARIFKQFQVYSNFIFEKIQQIGAPLDSFQRYIRSSDLDNKLKSENLRLFFHELSLYFHDLDI